MFLTNKSSSRGATPIFIIIVVVLMIIILIFMATIGPDGWSKPYGEVFGAFIGAAIVTAITFILLKEQSSNQNKVDRDRCVFENKVKEYSGFIEYLREIISKNSVTKEDEMRIRFQLANLAIHSNAATLDQIAPQLDIIINKIRHNNVVTNEPSFWKEISIITVALKQELYNISLDTSITSEYMNSAMFAFGSISNTQKPYIDILERISCNLSIFDIKVNVVDKMLKVEIPNRNGLKIKGFKKIRSLIFYINILENIDNDKLSGHIYVVSESIQNKKIVDYLYQLCAIWNNEKTVFYNTDPMSLFNQYHRDVNYFNFDKVSEKQLLLTIVQTINLCYELWANKTSCTIDIDENEEYHYRFVIDEERLKKIKEYKSKLNGRTNRK